MENKKQQRLINKIAFAVICAVSVIILCTFSLITANVHTAREKVDFAGVGVVSAEIGDFLSSDEVRGADKNAKYNVAVQLQNQCLFDYMTEFGFDGEFSEFVITDRAKKEKVVIENAQAQFVQILKNSGADVQVLSSLQASQNSVMLNIRLADFWRLDGLQQVVSVSFENTYYVPQDESSLVSSSKNNVQNIDFSNAMQNYGLNKSNNPGTEESSIWEAIGNSNQIFKNEKKYNNDTISFKGEGSLVAVIDNGFFASHKVFKTTPTTMKYDSSQNVDYQSSVGATISKKNSADAFDKNNAYAWYNNKIPFAYNYALNNVNTAPCGNSSHGTHVAGIAAGNDGSFKGVASEAQLMLCRVSNNDGGMTDASIAFAMDDCLTMGVDVVNISLGSNAGLDNEVNNIIYIAMQKLDAAGVAVVVAAGNEGTSAKKTANGKEKATSSNPDNGMIGSPASYLNSLAVANFARIGQTINDSSSRGVTNNMLLKPDISGFGTSVNSSVPGDGFGTMSGTSMASPNVAGALMAVVQYCKTVVDKDVSIATGDKKAAAQKMAIKLIMSTAEVVNQPNTGTVTTNGVAFSPRSQGAGVANLDRAITSLAYLQKVDGGRPKLDGVENSNENGVYDFEFEIVNMSDSDLIYELDVVTLTEYIENSFMSGLSKKLNPLVEMNLGSSYVDAKESNSIVAQVGKTNVKIRITLSADDKAQVKASCPNGMYVDGFVKLIDNNATRHNDLSMPFVAFYGDWYMAGDVLDATYYEVRSGQKNAYMRPSTLYGEYNGKNVPLGDYSYNLKDGEKVVVSQDKASISKQFGAMNKLSMLRMGLLRSCTAVVFELLDSNGNVISNSVSMLRNNSKTSWFESQKTLYGGDFDLGISASGLDEGKEYTYRASAYISYDETLKTGTGKNNVFTQKFVVDSAAPQINNAVYNFDGVKRTVTFDIVDNRYTQMFAVCKGISRGTEPNVTTDLYPYDIVPIETDGANQSKHFEVDVTQWVGDVSKSDLYFYTIDYAMNKQAYKLVYTDTDTDKGKVELVKAYVGDLVYNNLVFSSESVHLGINEGYNLSNMLLNANGKIVSWKTSNPLVVSVASNGLAKGLSDGNAVITAKIGYGGETATIAVNVGDNAEVEEPTVPTKTALELFKEALAALPKFEDITISDKAKVAEVRALYDKLSNEEKESKPLAFFYQQLIDAEAKIVDLESGVAAKKNDKLRLWIAIGIGGAVIIVVAVVMVRFIFRKREF